MNMQISEVLFYMAPATLVAFIADLDAHMAVAPDGKVDVLMCAALEALLANAGDDAIGMLENADTNVANPVIAAAIAEWREMA